MKKWVDVSLMIPAGTTQVRLAVLWSTPVIGAKTFISEVQFMKVEGEYQYHLKDHLGNVRMTVTSEERF